MPGSVSPSSAIRASASCAAPSQVGVVERDGAGQRLPGEPEGRAAELARGTLLRLRLGQALQPEAQVRQGRRVAGQDVPGGAVDHGDGDLVLGADGGEDREPGARCAGPEIATMGVPAVSSPARAAATAESDTAHGCRAA